jgi:phenylpropionate dioxygenase-like ring-hydroxylating dioxygenase large terminal subunit
LRALPVVVKYGMVWVCLTPGTPLDIDTLLDGVAPDFALYGFDTFHHDETRVLQRRINWKLAVDTFLESYHIGALHHDTIGPLYYSNLSTFDGFGRNLRWVIPRRTIGDLRTVPESQWDLISQTIVVYLLFPNTIFIMVQDHLQAWHMFPAGNGVNETRMYVFALHARARFNRQRQAALEQQFRSIDGYCRRSGFPGVRGNPTRVLLLCPGRHRVRPQRARTAATINEAVKSALAPAPADGNN